MLKPGDVAPEIDAPTSDGKRFVLSAQSHKLCSVVFFFPKAFTPGCALETRRFRESYAEIALLGGSIIGVSTDDHDTQCMFAESLKTPFPMIGDTSKTIARAYGVLWPILERAMRVTFVVDAQRKIVATIHHELNIGAHRDRVLRVMDELRSGRVPESDDASPSSPLTRARVEPYELLRVAGAGGMGTVHAARDKTTGRAVAVKVLAKDADPARFRLEIDVLKELVHPNVVAYVGHGTASDGRLFLAMEWLEGHALSSMIEDGPLGVPESVRIARDVARGLAAAHARGIVHRDVKPSNVFVTRDGAVKVLDFGIALSRERVAEALTRTGQLVGTPGYMAPEQARADRTVDARTDLFALGCLLFRCIEGKRPFAGDDALSLLHSVLHHPTPHLTNAPAALDALVTELLAKEMEDRPKSAAEVAERLEAI